MDPNATWAELLRAYRAADYPACRQASRDLLAWITRGGFPPAITGISRFDCSMARAVCAEHVYYEGEETADED